MDSTTATDQTATDDRAQEGEIVDDLAGLDWARARDALLIHVASHPTIRYRGVDVPLTYDPDADAFMIDGVVIGGINDDDMVAAGIVEAAVRADGKAGTLAPVVLTYRFPIPGDPEREETETYLFLPEVGGWANAETSKLAPFETTAATGEAGGDKSYTTAREYADLAEERAIRDYMESGPEDYPGFGSDD